MQATKPELKETSVDTPPSAEQSTASEPPPTLLPFDTISEPHEHRTFVLTRGSVLHIRVIAVDGRSTFLTFEG